MYDQGNNLRSYVISGFLGLFKSLSGSPYSNYLLHTACDVNQARRWKRYSPAVSNSNF